MEPAKLYTIQARGKPVLVMSVDADDESDALPQIDEAIDTWLGGDLTCLEHDGRPLWGGEDRGELHIRKASTEEATRWAASLEDAIRSRDEEPGCNDWLLFLVPVTDPTDEEFPDADCEEEACF